LIQQIMEATQRDASTRMIRARAAFDAWRKGTGILLADTPDGDAPSVAWHEEMGPEDELVARRGRLSDLIVVPQPSGEGGVVPTVSFEAALLDTGRPVLAVPQKAGALARLDEGPALIAWNGSIESSRAIWAALPFLSTARRVTILSVVEGGTAADAAQVRDYLGWHGVKAQMVVPAVKPAGVGAQILAEAEAQQAGLLVMGAYTRSRLRRMVFGGVTEHVLANAQLPVLMVH
jgi:nucleotide-binding universal stress UspA family protein